MNESAKASGLDGARARDKTDAFKALKSDFAFPAAANGKPVRYFAGHSLGLMPRRAPVLVQQELDAWAKYGVEAHFKGEHPWVSYHENVTEPLARLVGALPEEVVAMNSLTVNAHLLMVSFYRPTQTRYKILIESGAFPSDQYAVASQVRFHGLDPSVAVVELRPEAGCLTVSAAQVLDQIGALGDTLALVFLGNCNYLSGQRFDCAQVSEAAHRVGAIAGFNLAHGAGNLLMSLHDDEVDFAAWCSYKYLNAGPGGLAGIFIHQKHLKERSPPRFEGWWGHSKKTRFQMPKEFDPIQTAEAWQLSNPPILQLAALRASLELFDSAGMKNLREKGDQLTAYFEELLRAKLGNRLEVLTPAQRGSMLCLRIEGVSGSVAERAAAEGLMLDFREPDILRATPAPLYCDFEDVYEAVEILLRVMG